MHMEEGRTVTLDAQEKGKVERLLGHCNERVEGTGTSLLYSLNHPSQREGLRRLGRAALSLGYWSPLGAVPPTFLRVIWHGGTPVQLMSLVLRVR